MGAGLIQETVPTSVTLSRDRRGLTFAWDSRDGATLSAETMRLACRCAWCRRDRILECFPLAFEGVTITSVDPVGRHALHIAFSDGHARGMFPWPYLRDIADGVSTPTDGLAATHLLGCPAVQAPGPQQDRS